MYWSTLQPPDPHLAHEEDGVEDDEEHDEVLKGRGGDEPPYVVADPGLGLRHVNLLRLRLHHVGDTGLLQEDSWVALKLFNFSTICTT